MVLRDARTGHVITFRACAFPDRPGDITVVRTDADWGSSERIGGECPVHGGTDCVDMYIGRAWLASMSLRDLWRQWRAWRREGER